MPVNSKFVISLLYIYIIQAMDWSEWIRSKAPLKLIGIKSYMKYESGNETNTWSCLPCQLHPIGPIRDSFVKRIMYDSSWNTNSNTEGSYNFCSGFCLWTVTPTVIWRLLGLWFWSLTHRLYPLQCCTLFFHFHPICEGHLKMFLCLFEAFLHR